MAAFPYPKAAPSTFLGWIEEALSWAYLNVFWGGIAIFIGIFIPLLSGATPALSDDAILPITVLGMTICATQLEFPSELRIKHDTQRLWLSRGATTLCVVGAVLVVLSTPTAAAFRPPHGFLLRVSIWICLVAIVVGFWAYVLRTIALGEYLKNLINEVRSSETYAADVAQAQGVIVEKANSATEVDGLKL